MCPPLYTVALSCYCMLLLLFLQIDAERIVGVKKVHQISSSVTASVCLHHDDSQSDDEPLSARPKFMLPDTEGKADRM